MNTPMRLGVWMLAVFLGGCLTIAGDGFRLGNESSGQLCFGDSWQGDGLPEAKLQRLPVWYLSTPDSGILAHLFGVAGAQTVRYIDPYSPIVESNRVSATGSVTYLVKGEGDGYFVLKRVQLRADGVEPKVMGTLVRERDEIRFKPGNGKTYAAHSYILTAASPSRPLSASRTK